MKFVIILLSLFMAAYGYSSMPRLVSRKSMSIKAFDMSTLTTAVEVVAKPDGNSLSLSCFDFDFSCLLIYQLLCYWSLICVITFSLTHLGYVYGEVAAPSFVLPLFAVLAVLTAAIPFLLRPGKYFLFIHSNQLLIYLLPNSLYRWTSIRSTKSRWRNYKFSIWSQS